jgi:hypothetical protein
MKYFFLALIILASCEKYYISIRNIDVDKNYLSSVHVNTPDPRQEKPPKGQKLVVKWLIPNALIVEKPELILCVIYKNHTEETFRYEIKEHAGQHICSLLKDRFIEKKGFLTYKASIVTGKGEIYRSWQHQMWVNLINLEEDNR